MQKGKRMQIRKTGMWRISWPMSVTLTIAVSLGGPGQPSATAADPVLYGCMVKLDEDIKLPAPEAGVLVLLSVKEGSQVRKGDVIGKIDDREAQIQRQAAEHGLKAAYKAATDDVQIRYAEKSAAVAEKNYQVLIESNKSAAKAVPEIEVLKAKLEWDASILSAEKCCTTRHSPSMNTTRSWPSGMRPTWRSSVAVSSHHLTAKW